MNLQKFSPAARRSYQPDEIEAVGRALSSGRLSVVFGRETMRFEAEFAAFVGHRQAVALIRHELNAIDARRAGGAR